MALLVLGASVADGTLFRELPLVVQLLELDPRSLPLVIKAPRSPRGSLSLSGEFLQPTTNCRELPVMIKLTVCCHP